MVNENTINPKTPKKVKYKIFFRVLNFILEMNKSDNPNTDKYNKQCSSRLRNCNVARSMTVYT